MSVTLEERQLSTKSDTMEVPLFCVLAPGMSRATSLANVVRVLLGSRLVVTSTCKDSKAGCI
jgi:transcriptional regulatory protein LevR